MSTSDKVSYKEKLAKFSVSDTYKKKKKNIYDLKFSVANNSIKHWININLE
jgi:hypothetical protein